MTRTQTTGTKKNGVTAIRKSTKNTVGNTTNKKNNNHNSNDNDDRSMKERRQRSISLVRFGQSKGQVRALEEFKLRKERKRIETSKVLRRYKKTMKQEGYIAGTGASRKRKLEEESNGIPTSPTRTDEDVQEDQELEQQEEDDEKEQNEESKDNHPHEGRQKNKQKQQKKINPFVKSLEKAKEKKEEIERKKMERETNLKEREKKIRERRLQSKLLAKRTKRGQPIMKHTVENMLKKLQKKNKNSIPN